MKKANNTPPEQENPRMPLTRRNYILLAVGFAVILLGFVLMAGGGSDSPDEFNYAMFSWRRITLAPILVIGGFFIEIYAIMKRFEKKSARPSRRPASGGPFRPRHSAPPHRDSRCGATAQEIYPLKSVMDTLQAILLGIVQGITEFLPVSSSGHLQIAKELLGVELEENLTFDVALHAATVLSTIVVLWSEVWRLLKGLFSRRFNAEQAYVLKLVLSMIPIGVIGFLFKDRINAMLDAPYILVIVGAMLLLTATLLAFAYYAKPRQKETISYRDALIIGLAQACAAMPGLSRSGTTIATGLLLGNKKAAVAQFSFLMVLAPILGETLLEAASGDLTAGIATGTLAAGFAASFITGCLACKFMIEIVKRGKLIWFSLYCALAGLVSILSYFC